MADALSRGHDGSPGCSGILVVTPTWIEEVIGSYKEDKETEVKIHSLLINAKFDPDFTYENGLLKHKGKIYIGAKWDIRSKLIQNLHGSPEGGHSCIHSSLYRAKHQFYWPRMNQEIRQVELQCKVSKVQRGKCTLPKSAAALTSASTLMEPHKHRLH